MSRTARASKLYRIRQERGEPAAMPIHLVRQRIDRLHRLGLTTQMIAHAAGLDLTTIRNIKDRNTEHARIDIAAKIWKVDHRPHPNQKLVPAIGARRRVRALNALGWPTSELAARHGLSKDSFNQSLRCEHITYASWARVRDLYDELSGTPGPSETSRKRAHAEGHAPPLAWEDRDIDHPDTQPDWTAASIKLANRPVCVNNHRYTPDTTYFDTRGHRQCRKCRRAAEACKKAKRRAA